MKSCRRQIHLALAMALLTIASAAWAAQNGELTFLASVDRTQVGLDDHLLLTVSVSGKDIGGISEPQLPPLDGFEIVGTNRSSSSQFTLVNGKMTSSKTIDYIYTLRPLQEGKLSIGPATLNFRGQSYQTDPIGIQVLPGSAARSQTPPQTTAPPAPTVPEAQVSDDLFLQADFDRTTAYPGQQITVTYALYTRANLTNVQYGQIPSFTGFWVEEIYDAERLNFQERVIGGKRYQVAVLKKLALFPTTSGTVEVEPLQMVCDVSLPSRDFFDFFGRTKRVSVHSKAATIVVKSLPQEGRPIGFSGAVGQFTIQATVDHLQLRAGEPLELSVAIRGEGNIKTLPTPQLPSLDGFKTFDPEVKESVSKAGNRIGGSKTYTYVLIPKDQGQYRIGALSLAYFDPAKGQYQTVRTEPIAITVLPGQQEQFPLAAGLSKEEIKVLGTDIRYIKPAPAGLKNKGDELYRRPLFQALQTLPLLAILGAVLIRRRHDRIQGDVRYARRQGAMKNWRKNLRTAQRIMTQPSSDQFYGALSRALYEYLGDKLNIAASGITSQGLRQELEGRQADSELVQAVVDCLDACDHCRFAPLGTSGEDRQKMLDRAKGLVVRLERFRL